MNAGSVTATVKVRCSRCSGTGSVAHRTAKHDARCYCCGGAGHYFRKPAGKRVSAENRRAAEILAANARLRAAFPHLYDAGGDLIRKAAQ